MYLHIQIKERIQTSPFSVTVSVTTSPVLLFFNADTSSNGYMQLQMGTSRYKYDLPFQSCLLHILHRGLVTLTLGSKQQQVPKGGSQWGGGFYGYRLKFWLFYGYRLIFFSYS